MHCVFDFVLQTQLFVNIDLTTPRHSSNSNKLCLRFCLVRFPKIRSGNKFLFNLLSYCVILTMVYKKCFVPACGNDSDNSEHIFIPLPRDFTKRAKWFKAAGLKPVTWHTKLYCCEDHFKLEECSENWMEFKIIGSRLKLKEGIVPYIFLNSPLPSVVQSQLSSSTKKQRAENLKNLANAKRPFFTFVDTTLSTVKAASSVIEPVAPTIKEEIPSVPSSTEHQTEPVKELEVQAFFQPPPSRKKRSATKRIHRNILPKYATFDLQIGEPFQREPKGTATEVPVTFQNVTFVESPSCTGESNEESENEIFLSSSSSSLGQLNGSGNLHLLETKSNRFYVELPKDVYLLVDPGQVIFTT